MHSTMNQPINLLDDRDCLSANELQAYLANTLAAAARHSVESHLLDCPLCSDAVDGLLAHKSTVSAASLRQAKQSGLGYSSKRIWLAAASILFFGALGAWLFVYLNPMPTQAPLAINQQEISTPTTLSETPLQITSDQVTPETKADPVIKKRVAPATRIETEEVKGTAFKAQDASKPVASLEALAKNEEGVQAEQAPSSAPVIFENQTRSAAPSLADAKATTVKSEDKAAKRSIATTEDIDPQSNTANSESNIQKLYAEGQYARILNTLHNDKSQEALLIKGKCLNKQRNYKEALQLLQQINTPGLKGEADWTSASCYIGLNKPTKAAEILKKIAQEAGPFQQEAQEKLNTIK